MTPQTALMQNIFPSTNSCWFLQMQHVPSLPDRLATALSVYLPNPQPWTPPPTPTASAGATEPIAKSALGDTRITRNTRIEKRNIVGAFRAAARGRLPKKVGAMGGSVVEAGARNARGSYGRSAGQNIKKRTLAGLTRAVEVGERFGDSTMLRRLAMS